MAPCILYCCCGSIQFLIRFPFLLITNFLDLDRRKHKIQNPPTTTPLPPDTPLHLPHIKGKMFMHIEQSLRRSQQIQEKKKNWERYTCARFFPVTTPMRAARDWQRIAAQLKISTSSTKSNPKREPPSINVAHFPGSIYPTEIRNRGPTVGSKRDNTPDVSVASDSICC